MPGLFFSAKIEQIGFFLSTRASQTDNAGHVDV
jgi:hypothetical protein